MGSNSAIKAILSDEELEKTSTLLCLVWPKSGFTKKYLKWLYCDNPIGCAEAYNVWADGQIVAHYAAIPIKENLHSINEKGLLSLNTAVHPSHRGKGYFKKLASCTYDDAFANGFNFVVGVANANSFELFIKQLQFQHVCQLGVKIGIGVVQKTRLQKSEL